MSKVTLSTEFRKVRERERERERERRRSISCNRLTLMNWMKRSFRMSQKEEMIQTPLLAGSNVNSCIDTLTCTSLICCSSS